MEVPSAYIAMKLERQPQRIGEKIVALVKTSGLSQRRNAIEMGVSPSDFAKWCRGVRRPSSIDLLELGRYFSVPVEYLLDDEQDEPEFMLTAEEARILELVHKIGFDLAEKRLLGLPGSGSGDPPGGEGGGKGGSFRVMPGLRGQVLGRLVGPKKGSSGELPKGRKTPPGKKPGRS